MSSHQSERSIAHFHRNHNHNDTISSPLHTTAHAVPPHSNPPLNPAFTQEFYSAPLSPTSHPSSISSSRSNSDADDTPPSGYLTNRHLLRPKLGRRKSSGTMIIPSNSPRVVQIDEEYDIDDARTMSPRRTSEEIEQLANESRQTMMDQAKALQESLLDIVDRVESIKSEHEKLEGGNRFLQSYIGELMQTSKITSAGAPKPKGKARAGK